ncbi:MAG: hypothetical protein IJG74_02645 [Prevotella sp.]|nr:hypothetical protein [Prevotella sp.]
MFFYYNVAAALILVGGAVWATAFYWRKRTAWQRQMDDQRLSLELFRADVARESALKTCKNNRDVMSHVLRQVQALQEGIDSLLVLLTTSDIVPGQEEWDLTCGLIKKKSALLADVLTVAFEMMYYENRQSIGRNDQIVVNEFCHDVFEGCLDMLAEGVETRFETALDDDCVVRTDIDTLRRLLRNLLLNAVDNTRQGTVTLKLSSDESKQQLVFAVTDTGPAIPPEFKEKIFKRLPNINIHQLLLTLRVRTGKLMAHLLGGTLFFDSYMEKSNTVVFTITV